MTKAFYAYIAIALVLGGLIGYAIVPNVRLGSSLTYSSVSNSLEQYNYQKQLLADLQAVRAPLSGILQATATQNLVNIGQLGGSTSTATSSITVTGAAVGDFCLIGTSTSTLNVALACDVTAANTAVYRMTNLQGNGTVAVSTTTITVNVLPKATFVAAAAIVNATTSTP